jgi:hypothetical protein
VPLAVFLASPERTLPPLSMSKLIAFVIGMLGLGKPERTKLRNALEPAGVEFDPAGGVKLKDHAA